MYQTKHFKSFGSLIRCITIKDDIYASTKKLARIDSKAVDSKAVGYIVGGEYGDASEYTHLVRIVADNQMCGGCLIAKNAVLTAAHCTLNTNPNAYDIRQGKTTQQEMESSERLKAISVHPHKEYDKQLFRADITVILIDPNHSLTNFLTPDESKVSEGTPVHLAGWGKENPTGSVSPQLKTLDLKVISDSVCKGNFPIYEPQTHLCASSPVSGHSSCMGDSGGPLVSDKDTIVGVVSYGDQMCNRAGTSYTRVSTYTAWINTIVGNMGSKNQTTNSESKDKPTECYDSQYEQCQPTSKQPGMPNYPPQPIQSPEVQPDQSMSYEPQDFYQPNPPQNQYEPIVIYYGQEAQFAANPQVAFSYNG